jgi:hypothetical protein
MLRERPTDERRSPRASLAWGPRSTATSRFDLSDSARQARILTHGSGTTLWNRDTTQWQDMNSKFMLRMFRVSR